MVYMELRVQEKIVSFSFCASSADIFFAKVWFGSRRRAVVFSVNN